MKDLVFKIIINLSITHPITLYILLYNKHSFNKNENLRHTNASFRRLYYSLSIYSTFLSKITKF